MLKVLSVLPVKNQTCIAFEGSKSDIESLKIGDKLIGSAGKELDVLSVGMTHFKNPEDISKRVLIMTTPCDVKEDDEFSVLKQNKTVTF